MGMIKPRERGSGFQILSTNKRRRTERDSPNQAFAKSQQPVPKAFGKRPALTPTGESTTLGLFPSLERGFPYLQDGRMIRQLQKNTGWFFPFRVLQKREFGIWVPMTFVRKMSYDSLTFLVVSLRFRRTHPESNKQNDCSLRESMDVSHFEVWTIFVVNSKFVY